MQKWKGSKMNYAIIPARGGSKRIPKKNIKDFNGVPALARTIQFLGSLDMFSEIVVSTDDEEISAIGLEAGATRIIHRTDDLASDLMPTVPVIADVVRKILGTNAIDANICCVYPINPFLEKETLENGLQILCDNESISYVNTIVSYPYPIDRALIRNTEGLIQMKNTNNLTERSQEFVEYYHDAGQWYWGKSETWLAEAPLLSNSIGIPISRWLSQDIDTIEDWKQAELLSKVLNLS